MNELATLAVVVVAACAVTYTIVEIVRSHIMYKRQKEALDRWLSAYYGVRHGVRPDSEEERHGKWQ